MLRQQAELELSRCPYCNVDKPRLPTCWQTTTKNHSGQDERYWVFYYCVSCGGVVTTASFVNDNNREVMWLYPKQQQIDKSIPDKAKTYLTQALASLHAPAGAVMLAASAVDAMLKTINYREGSLNSRIDQAAKDHRITKEMAEWAHEVRLDANDQRHADEETVLPSPEDAKRTIEFSTALGEFLFVLPERVSRGRQQSQSTQSAKLVRV